MTTQNGNHEHILHGDLVIHDLSMDLVLLRKMGSSDGMHWENFKMQFVGISMEDFMCHLDLDSRDLVWFISNPDRTISIPFCEFSVMPQSSNSLVAVKYIGCYRNESFDSFNAGGLQCRVTQERAPFSWDKPNYEQINNLLHSKDSADIFDALGRLISFCISIDSRWATEVFCRFVQHEEASVRLMAATGFGELSRVSSYCDHVTVVPLVKILLNDPVIGVRTAARKAMNEIERFT
jgi:hypothetical protein